jgi:hypothetical protein
MQKLGVIAYSSNKKRPLSRKKITYDQMKSYEVFSPDQSLPSQNLIVWHVFEICDTLELTHFIICMIHLS